MTIGPAGRPVALVTGAGRRRGIATAVARRLAETGWDVAFTHLGAYDARMPWGLDAGAAEELTDHVRATGARAHPVEADFAGVTAAERVFSHVRRLGQPRDAANVVAFLCSPDGGWINGQLIHSDGGLGS